MNAIPRALLLDTHAAIWYVDGTLPNEAADRILRASRADGVFVSVASAWEIGLLARPRAEGGPRMEFLPDPEKWFETLLSKPTIRLAELTPSIAIASSHLPGEIHGDPADRLLVATARERGIALMTRDRKILDYAEAGHVAAIAC